jgi:hypothetical protein
MTMPANSSANKIVSTGTSSSLRMKLPMTLLQPRLVDVRIDLGGGKTRVTEHFLDRSQVITAVRPNLRPLQPEMRLSE